MEIRIVNVSYLGDLYRFYVSRNGDIVEVRLYVDMSTAFTLLQQDDIPGEVLDQFETKYMYENK
jgi:hypothetical protein